MGIYDRKVIAIIGRDIWDHILNNVTCGILNTQHMCDIASLVPQPTWGKLSLANALFCLEPNEVFKESLRPLHRINSRTNWSMAWLRFLVHDHRYAGPEGSWITLNIF